MVFKTFFLQIILGSIFTLKLFSSVGQTTITVKYFGLTIHPTGDPTAALQPHKLDRNAHFVANFGGFVGVEHFVYKDYISVKLIQGLFTDCSGGWCSVTHIGGRLLLYKKPKHRIYFGIGPAYMLRNSWTRFGPAYQASGFFRVDSTQLFGVVQHRFLPVSFELEYDWVVSLKNQVSFSFTPGVPLACIFSIGWKHWFSVRDYENKVKVL